MKRLRDLGFATAQRRIKDEGVYLEVGPFIVVFKTKLDKVIDTFVQLYAAFPLAETDFADFHCSITLPKTLRRWIKPQVDFLLDEYRPFHPLPIEQAFPMFEWGFNWCITNHAHQYLQLHAAGLEKDGVMVIMPAPPGSGKSTLTAALMNHGWRLFSDEIVLIGLQDGLCHPIARPINLKNNSIEVYKSLENATVVSPLSKDTIKGTVALAMSTEASVYNMRVAVKPSHILFPKYERGHGLEISQQEKGKVVLDFITNSFNYHLLGIEGFERATSIVHGCDCIHLTYSKFEDAFEFFDAL